MSELREISVNKLIYERIKIYNFLGFTFGIPDSGEVLYIVENENTIKEFHIPYDFESCGFNRCNLKDILQMDDVLLKKEIKDNIYEFKIEKYKAYGFTKFVFKELLTDKLVTLDIADITYNDFDIIISNNRNITIQFSNDTFIDMNEFLSILDE